ncbi:MAG: hypothetical protein ACREVT_05515 [Burkholderiales bacterium]
MTNGIHFLWENGKAAGQMRVDPSKLPFDPKEFIKQLKGWEGTELDQVE